MEERLFQKCGAFELNCRIRSLAFGQKKNGKGMVDKGMEITTLPSYSRVPNSFVQTESAAPSVNERRLTKEGR
jgi:hypothetical protein